MSLYHYADDFFAYQQVGALASARAIVPVVQQALGARSVLDLGCGAGAWVSAWLEAGLRDVTGVDGDYVDRERLMFDPISFRAADLSQPVRLGRLYSLAQCLEVAEHLDPDAAATLVDNLVAHAPIVLFSAAPPGQGGEHHVNERPYAYWRDLFEQRGYELFDYVRPRVAGLRQIECWYRYNTLLFVAREAVDALPPAVAATRVAPGVEVPDVAPMSWRLRRALLAPLPPRAIDWMAGLKHRAVLGARSHSETV